MTGTRLITIASVLSLAIAGYSLMLGTSMAATQDQFDVAGTYKTKCVACHGAAADKRFDSSIAEPDLIAAVLKGKKAEKPPNMPAYEEKGINEDQAKALVTYMKSLKQ